jgi:hypothetical protein
MIVSSSATRKQKGMPMTAFVEIAPSALCAALLCNDNNNGDHLQRVN